MSVSIRLGVNLWPQNTTWPDLRKHALLADQHGFDSLWVWDHFYSINGDLHRPNLEGWQIQSAYAALTKNVRIGCLVTGITHRHPAVLANMATTLDNIASDFPLHASFVPFIERVSGYLAGSGEGTSSTTVDSVIALRGERDRNASAEVLDPAGKRALDLRQATTAATFSFPGTGFWEVRTAGGRHSMYAVNTDRRESDLTRIPDENLALWSGPGARSTDGTAVPGAPSEPQRSPLWKYFLIALIALAVAESLVADRFTPAAEAKEPEPLVKREAA
jgi:hypothetical protein